LEELRYCAGTVRVENVPFSKYIEITDRKQTEVVRVDEVLGDDVEKWHHREEAFAVEAAALTTAVEEVCERPLTEVKYVSVTLDRDENRLVVADKDEVRVAHVPISTSAVPPRIIARSGCMLRACRCISPLYAYTIIGV
jgi:hypothetical protein